MATTGIPAPTSGKASTMTSSNCSIVFEPASESEMLETIQSHLSALRGPLDSYLDDHISESNHYRIHIDGEAAGYTSIYKESLIVQFALEGRFRRHGQDAFIGVRRLETARGALVPTADPYYLSHALDDFSKIAKQAYLFEVGSEEVVKKSIGKKNSFHLRPAERADLEMIDELSGDFLEDPERHIRAHELYVTMRKDDPVGFGLIERSRFIRGNASVGMYTVESQRGTGISRETLNLLIQLCEKEQLRPVAGCWYYNHISKRSLESAGMVSTGRYLRIDY